MYHQETLDRPSYPPTHPHRKTNDAGLHAGMESREGKAPHWIMSLPPPSLQRRPGGGGRKKSFSPREDKPPTPKRKPQDCVEKKSSSPSPFRSMRIFPERNSTFAAVHTPLATMTNDRPLEGFSFVRIPGPPGNFFGFVLLNAFTCVCPARSKQLVLQ